MEETSMIGRISIMLIAAFFSGCVSARNCACPRGTSVTTQFSVDVQNTPDKVSATEHLSVNMTRQF
jgi:hypothetical protein